MDVGMNWTLMVEMDVPVGVPPARKRELIEEQVRIALSKQACIPNNMT